MISGLPTRPRIPYLPGAGCCRIWASSRSRCPKWRSSCPPRNHARPGAESGGVRGQLGAAPASAADRACQQQCEALSHRQRSDPPVEGGRTRSRDGHLLCPAPLPGAPHALATDGLIGINLTVLTHVAHRPPLLRVLQLPAWGIRPRQHFVGQSARAGRIVTGHQLEVCLRHLASANVRSAHKQHVHSVILMTFPCCTRSLAIPATQ